MSNAIKKERLEVPIWHKPFLTIEEATAYTGIGRDTLREMTRFADCPFVLWVGHRRMIKRELFDEYIGNSIIFCLKFSISETFSLYLPVVSITNCPYW